MLYKKIPIKGYKQLGQYPVYTESLYHGHEPLKIVGIRENQVELEGGFSGGTDDIYGHGSQWYDDKDVFVVSAVCPEQLKPKGCQIHNVNCCGGGSIIKKHEEYWKHLN